MSPPAQSPIPPTVQRCSSFNLNVDRLAPTNRHTGLLAYMRDLDLDALGLVGLFLTK